MSAAAASFACAKRFNGPPGSAQGGYFAGLLAARTGIGGPVSVLLRKPPPLDTDLTVVAARAARAAGSVEARQGGVLFGTAGPGSFRATASWPEALPVATAAEAATRFFGSVGHPYPTCYVCGPDRTDPDALRLFAGAVQPGSATAACPWSPAASQAPDGTVAPETVWAALDCPSGWTMDLTARPMLLARMTAEIRRAPAVGEPCVVVGRHLSDDWPSSWTCSVVYSAEGELLAAAEQVWMVVGGLTGGAADVSQGTAATR
jgi:hypothetical protein